jgi:hypothetical protein
VAGDGEAERRLGIRVRTEAQDEGDLGRVEAAHEHGRELLIGLIGLVETVQREAERP